MKKLTAILLTLAMVVSLLGACGLTDPNATATPAQNNNTAADPGSSNPTQNNNTNTTTVNLLNGVINGGAYGGGLGQKSGVNGATSNVEAHVYGKVHVNIGSWVKEPTATDTTYYGMATLTNCEVYGCNNLNGSPNDDVFVDVYKTNHTTTDEADYEENDATYAIYQVCGGGNNADYEPENGNTSSQKKLRTYVHRCENTVEKLFGGSNAAFAQGVHLTIDGGRLDWAFGGGNGEVSPADIGTGNIYLWLGGGHINLYVNGSNDNGTIYGDIYSNTFNSGCSDAVVEDHFMGSNQTPIYGGVEETINCGDPMQYRNLYCGSNKAQIYGDIRLTIKGGVFENVFGGSKGDLASLTTPGTHTDYASNIKQFPTTIPSAAEDPGLHAYMTAHPDVAGTGGNVYLVINGGTIGTLYGACDINGNIEGKIDMTIMATQTDCPLFIGNIFGGGNTTSYEPLNSSLISPEIKILKGTIGGARPATTTFLQYESYAGNVYGGGYQGNVTANPRIVIGDPTAPTSPVTIEGNVFGGGDHGNVTGSPQVIIVPAN